LSYSGAMQLKKKLLISHIVYSHISSNPLPTAGRVEICKYREGGTEGREARRERERERLSVRGSVRGRGARMGGGGVHALRGSCRGESKE
jgi:hypothetical protein